MRQTTEAYQPLAFSLRVLDVANGYEWICWGGEDEKAAGRSDLIRLVHLKQDGIWLKGQEKSLVFIPRT